MDSEASEPAGDGTAGTPSAWPSVALRAPTRQRPPKFGLSSAGSATVQALRRNDLCPPPEITFRGAPRPTAPAHRDDESVQKRSHYEPGDLSESSYRISSEAKTHRFPKAFPRTALTFRGAIGQTHFFHPASQIHGQEDLRP